MVNNKHKNKLNELIKQTLSNYEAPYITADWPQMERILDSAPKSSSYRYKQKLLSSVESLSAISKSKSVKWLFSPYFLIAVILGLGAYFLYNILSSSNSFDDTTNATPEQTISMEPKESSASAYIPTDSSTVENEILPMPDTTSAALLTNDKTAVQTSEPELVKKENTVQKKINLIEKIEKTDKTVVKKLEPVLLKPNTTVLPVLSDSAKVIGEKALEKTETNPTQLENKPQPENSPGRNNFLLPANTADSIKKYKSTQPLDSL